VMPVAPYDSDEYREWNRKRMAEYRRGPYGNEEYIRRLTRRLEAQRPIVEAQLAEASEEVKKWTDLLNKENV
jgi:hypothetical protein